MSGIIRRRQLQSRTWWLQSNSRQRHCEVRGVPRTVAISHTCKTVKNSSQSQARTLFGFMFFVSGRYGFLVLDFRFLATFPGIPLRSAFGGAAEG